MLICFIRASVIYFSVLFAIRFLGKRQISEFQPFELVITIMIADIVTQPIGDVNVPLLNGIIPLVVLVFLQTLISFITYKNEKMRAFICGKPEYLIYDGDIMQKQMSKMLIGIDDLCEQLRNNDIVDLNEVSYMILESNGQSSFIKKMDNGIPVSLIKYGKRMYESFKLVGYTDERLTEELKHRDIKDDKDVFWAYIYDNVLYIIRKDKLK
ncbi:DUF421 domain-containing protein [Anaerofustis stercorihominis]|uniref:DUF421 domain-containing protein n=1 Tax=Anaerofustis stercorihominis TaxID=214853 RepID=UPI00210EB8FA|nr:DUF421 domain-containing protein [Anaerofustis stercorihominis]MCQ4794429.1 DUF421 domain-containing protein [Anaerofustis stercorihominis]